MIPKLRIALTSCLMLFAWSNQVYAGDDMPRQFTTWASRAPEDWVERSAVPEGYSPMIPLDNMKMPDVDEAATRRGWVVFTKPTFELVFPVTAPFAGEITSTLRAFATPGEYVPITFSVRSLRQINDLSVSADELKTAGGDKIPNSHVDIRVVRCLPVSAQYIDINKKPPAADSTEKAYIITPAFMETFDAVDVPEQTTQRFWITVKIPDNAPEGIYQSTLTVKDLSGASQELDLRIRVLPFALKPTPPDRMVYAVLYNGTDPRKGSHGRGLFNENVPKHFVDMAEHGMNTVGYLKMEPHYKLVDGEVVVSFSQPNRASHSMEDIMRFYREAGFNAPIIHQKGPYDQIQYRIKDSLGYEKYTPEFDDAFKKINRAIVDKVKQEGWPELIYALGDEPGSSTEAIKQTLHYGRLIKEVAPEIRTTNFFNGDWGGTKDWYLLKEVTDICCSNFVTKDILNERQKAGYDIQWIYNGGSAGSRMPIADRLFYGFNAWKLLAGGVCQYIYQKINGDAFNHLDSHNFNNWNVREYLYAYPTPQGPLPTPCWEAVRAGTYDWRYLLTLEELIGQAKSSQSSDLRKLAEAALAEMNSVMDGFGYDYHTGAKNQVLSETNDTNMTVARWRIARQIILLNEQLNKVNR